MKWWRRSAAAAETSEWIRLLSLVSNCCYFSSWLGSRFNVVPTSSEHRPVPPPLWVLHPLLTMHSLLVELSRLNTETWEDLLCPINSSQVILYMCLLTMAFSSISNCWLHPAVQKAQIDLFTNKTKKQNILSAPVLIWIANEHNEGHYMLQFPRLISLFAISTQNTGSNSHRSKSSSPGGGPAFNNNNVEAFLGIPYAAAPIGSLRYLPPASPGPWGPSIRPANILPPACPQQMPPLSNRWNTFSVIVCLSDCITIQLYRSAAQMLYRDVGNIFLSNFPVRGGNQIIATVT